MFPPLMDRSVSHLSSTNLPLHFWQVKFAPDNLPPHFVHIFSNLPSHFSQVKFALTGPQGGEMFECKSEAESPMLGLGHFYDKAELLANGNFPIL